MTRITCAPKSVDLGPADLEIVLYGHSNADQGEIGARIPGSLGLLGLAPAPKAWDLLSLALSIVGADMGVSRSDSPDGWTRQIDLHVAVADPDFWNTQVNLLNCQLRFLTTDIWNVSFHAGGPQFGPPECIIEPEQDSVVLLSGGLDSLIGTSDLVKRYGRTPYAVSQISRGDRDHQILFASKIGNGLPHLQLNHDVRLPGTNEPSQRSRSIIFLAYGVLAATALGQYHRGETVPLYVCENGFISINPPLTPSRLGSLSTRTTHPAFIKAFQQLLNNAGLRVRLENPYQFRTKGEMLRNAADQELMRQYAHVSTSCGRFARNIYTHCGRCLPCLVRRAAFHAWGWKDRTDYVYSDLSRSDHDDVRSVALAILSAEERGITRWANPSLSTAFLGDIVPYRDVISRGLSELAGFLKAVHVL